MKNIIQKYACFVFLLLLWQSCQMKENEEVKTAADASFLIGKVWKIASTKVDDITKDVLGFQNQIEIRFEVGGKGTVTYADKEFGKDTTFEWEMSKDKKTILLKENQVVTPLEITDLTVQDFQYQFVQNGINYIFNLKSL